MATHETQSSNQPPSWPLLMAVAAVFSWSSAAWGQNSWDWVVTATSVVSDGAKDESTNGVVSVTYSGPDFHVWTLWIQGNDVAGDPTSWPNELRIQIKNLDTQQEWCSGELHPGTSYFPPGSVAVGPVTFNAASLGLIRNGDDIEIRAYESHDDAVFADAGWNDLKIVFHRPVPVFPYAHLAYVRHRIPLDSEHVSTAGSNYLTALALFTADGALVNSDDASDDPTGAAYISLDGLPPGEYHLCCAASGGTFGHGFQAAPSPAAVGGTLDLTYPGGNKTIRTHSDSVLWYRLTIDPPACSFPETPMGDMNCSGTVDGADIQAFVDAVLQGP